jgi:hypothetical protein
MPSLTVSTNVLKIGAICLRFFYTKKKKLHVQNFKHRCKLQLTSLSVGMFGQTSKVVPIGKQNNGTLEHKLSGKSLWSMAG